MVIRKRGSPLGAPLGAKIKKKIKNETFEFVKALKVGI